MKLVTFLEIEYSGVEKKIPLFWKKYIFKRNKALRV